MTTDTKELEKAYGGCHDCYGKGYSTVATANSGYGTDGDIGGREGRYYKPYEKIVYCACERGKQLRSVIDKQTLPARLDEVSRVHGGTNKAAIHRAPEGGARELNFYDVMFYLFNRERELKGQKKLTVEEWLEHER